jgi:ABC-type multidrug transport system ATPase subunit
MENWTRMIPGVLDNPLERAVAASSSRGGAAAMDDEEALRWAAMERLPTYDRVRTSVVHDQDTGSVKQIDVRQMSPLETSELLDKLMAQAQDETNTLLLKMRKRLDKVGIELPTIEVRYENLTIEADCYVGDRALPSNWNTTRNFVEMVLDKLHLWKSKKAKLTILDNVSGIIKPGRMTLLLGPPGSGKTTLLKALAGRLDPDLRVTGKVTLNGHTHSEFVPQRTAAYISQRDLHVGEMTVRETLDFSAKCQGVGARYELLEEISRREKEAGIYPEADVDAFMKMTSIPGKQRKVGTDYTLRMLGLDVCADTLVGDEMRRGISGGQKKRVTTGEMIVGPCTALFMDDISTGLDSSTTYNIIRTLGQFTHLVNSTVLISLLQPAPETFNLFDDIILLSEGQCVYHGPRQQVMSFFEACGFKCPDRKGIADFLQEVTSPKDQEQYWANTQRPYRYIPVREFSELFKQFQVGATLQHELAVPYPKERSHRAALGKKKYAVSKKELFKANFAKEWLLYKRNAVISVFKIVQVFFAAFISMTVFFRTRIGHETVDDANQYLSAIFFAIMTVMFGGFGEMAMTIERLPVIVKQRDLLFFPAWSYALSAFVLSIPASIIESVVWVGMTYYVTGYAPQPERFFKQMLLLCIVEQMAGAMFRFFAGLCRTMILAQTLANVLILILFVTGGFLVPRTDMPPWWIWAYWISPMTYADSALSVNELLAPRWQHLAPNSTNTVGVEALVSKGQFPYARMYWIGVGALLLMCLIYNIGFVFVLGYMPAVGSPQAVMTEEDLAMKEAAKAGGPLDATALRKKTKNSRKNGTLRSRHTKKVPSHRELQLSRSRNSNRQIVVPSETRGMVLPFEPLSISFDSINYYVDMPAEMKHEGMTETKLKLLTNITGSFRPGVLTALVGVSGAGKTTLMDVLAGRKTGGYIEGEIRIAGYPKKQETFARIAGYCEQNDIHSPQLDVRESLVYSAWLRLSPDITNADKLAFVDQVMDLVELNPIEHALVGLPGITGLSTEQRKRLTIAVELVANPSIIFMDEPTSGLDARAAAIVMRTVRNTVDTGRTVVCTIHQPSIDIFEAFDEMLLLKRGGRIIYNGPLGHNSDKLIEYFQAIPGVPKIKEGYNPATWMLDVTNHMQEEKLGVDFSDLYMQSDLYQRNKQLVEDLKTPEPGSRDLYFPNQFAQSYVNQLRTIFWKMNITYWRSPDYNLVRYIFTFFISMIFGSLFWQLGTKRETSRDLGIAMAALYGSCIFLCFTNCGAVQPVVSIERTVFYREKAAGMYSALPYALSQVLVEIPYVFVQVLMYATTIYAMIGFEWTAAKYFWFFFILFFGVLYHTYYGMMMVSLTPNATLATICASFFYAIFNLFSGFLIPKPLIPPWWIWYYWICPLSWVFSGLANSQFGDISTQIVISGTGGQTKALNQYLKDYYGIERSFLKFNAVGILGWTLFFAIVFCLAIKKLNFQRR